MHPYCYKNVRAVASFGDKWKTIKGISAFKNVVPYQYKRESLLAQSLNNFMQK